MFRRIFSAFRIRGAVPTVPLQTNAENGDAACDVYGNLWVRQAPVPADTGGQHTQVFVPGVNIGQAAGFNSIITQVGGFNDNAVPLYVQLWNQLAAPGAGDAPNLPIFYVPAGSTFSWDPASGGLPTTDGIWFTTSSTRDTYTPMAETIHFFCQFLDT